MRKLWWRTTRSITQAKEQRRGDMIHIIKMNKFLENNFLSSKPIISLPSPPWCNCIGYQSMKSFLAANKICACVHLRPKSGSLDVCLRRCLHSATKERKWMRCCCISPPSSFHRDSLSNRPGTLPWPILAGNWNYILSIDIDIKPEESNNGTKNRQKQIWWGKNHISG